MSDYDSALHLIAQKIRAWTPTEQYPIGVEPVFYFDHPMGKCVGQLTKMMREAYQQGFEAGQENMRYAMRNRYPSNPLDYIL